MALTVTSGYRADLGWNKRIYAAAGGTLLDITSSVSDAQVNSEVETESYSVYGTPNDKNVSTGVSYPLVINTMYATPTSEQFSRWLESSTPFHWVEIVDTATASNQFAEAGTFTLALYATEGVTLGAAPTDGLIEFGLTTAALGEAFEGAAYPFTAAAAGALSLGTVTALTATDRIWVVFHEVNGSSVTLTPSVGGTAGTALDVDETKADLYELTKDDAADTGALVVTLAATGISAGSPISGYILVGKSVT